MSLINFNKVSLQILKLGFESWKKEFNLAFYKQLKIPTKLL